MSDNFERKYILMNDINNSAKMHEILALIKHAITQLSEDDAQDFVMDLQEQISEMLPS